MTIPCNRHFPSYFEAPREKRLQPTSQSEEMRWGNALPAQMKPQAPLVWELGWDLPWVSVFPTALPASPGLFIFTF